MLIFYNKQAVIKKMKYTHILARKIKTGGKILARISKNVNEAVHYSLSRFVFSFTCGAIN